MVKNSWEKYCFKTATIN